MSITEAYGICETQDRSNKGAISSANDASGKTAGTVVLEQTVSDYRMQVEPANQASMNQTPSISQLPAVDLPRKPQPVLHQDCSNFPSPTVTQKVEKKMHPATLLASRHTFSSKQHVRQKSISCSPDLKSDNNSKQTSKPQSPQPIPSKLSTQAHKAEYFIAELPLQMPD